MVEHYLCGLFYIKKLLKKKINMSRLRAMFSYPFPDTEFAVLMQLFRSGLSQRDSAIHKRSLSSTLLLPRVYEE